MSVYPVEYKRNGKKAVKFRVQIKRKNFTFDEYFDNQQDAERKNDEILYGLKKWVPRDESTFWLMRMEASSTTASSRKWTREPELNIKQVFLDWHDEGEINPSFNYDKAPSLALEQWVEKVLEKICQANGYLAKEEFSKLLKPLTKTKQVTV